MALMGSGLVHGHGRACHQQQQPRAHAHAHAGRLHATGVRLGPGGRAPLRPCAAATNNAFKAPSSSKDASSELLERLFYLTLTTRLKQHTEIKVDVRCNGWALLEGRFGGMTINGRRWRTPLELTAERVMVDMGEMQIDYGKLVMQRVVALRNVPRGSCALTLTAHDLGNFMVHPIMKGAAAKAVQNKAFVFDRTTVGLSLEAATGCGTVTYEGVWAGDGQRYHVTMVTPPLAAGRGASGLPTTSSVEQLQVSVHVVPPTVPGGSMASADSGDERPPAAAGAGAVAGGASSSGMGAGMAMSGGSLVVAEGLRRFFSGFSMNLQGIELQRPNLVVLPGAAGPAAPLLQITMQMQMLAVPPLNMKF